MRLLAMVTVSGVALSTLTVPEPLPGIAPEAPCPALEVDRPVGLPTPPEPPPGHSPGDRQLGGAALAAAELVIPETAPTPPPLTATTWLVADLDSGAVLGACGPHEYAIPASTQKLLLAAALMSELDPDEVVEVVPEDLDIVPGSSAVGLLVGGRYTIETLWLGLMLNSGNDAANVLARLGGGEDGVAGGLALMNAEAQRLGAYQTFAATPSGLDGPGQYTSAYDLALIARPLFDREDFLDYVGADRAAIPPQPPQDPRGFEIQNDNGLLLNYPGALGGKTGFTDLARHSFVGAAQRDDRRLVVTVLGAEAQPLTGWQQAAELLDWGFALPAEAAVGRLVEPEELAAVASSSTEPPVEPAGSAGGEAAAALAPGRTWATAAVAATALLLSGVFAALAYRSARRRRG
ncbi:D-alanyl-D-alanine carboxypeptidase family protein [Natronosporangium hydrolyticum]|uniref:D-alanyl-D-alanine carboxypeptidase family protein n=1 Tax=Natronosporangium hydrolyticum TaxID=2811111 RepID=UPI003B848E65